MRVAVILLLAACSSNDDIPAPQLAGVVPDQAAAGSIVLVDGSFLCQQPPPSPDDPSFPCDSDGVISFDQTPGIATSAWTDTGVMVQVPDGATGQVQVTATMSGRTSNGVSFTIE